MQIKFNVEALEDGLYLVQYFVDDKDYVMSFTIEEGRAIPYRLENIYRIDYKFVAEAYEYFNEIEMRLLEEIIKN